MTVYTWCRETSEQLGQVCSQNPLSGGCGSPTGPSVWAAGGLRSRRSGIKEFTTVMGVCGWGTSGWWW